MGTGSDQSFVRSWLVQLIKELSSAAVLCAGRGCALIRQLANSDLAADRLALFPNFGIYGFVHHLKLTLNCCFSPPTYFGMALVMHRYIDNIEISFKYRIV